jgi:hypothetical protein
MSGGPSKSTVARWLNAAAPSRIACIDGCTVQTRSFGSRYAESWRLRPGHSQLDADKYRRHGALAILDALDFAALEARRLQAARRQSAGLARVRCRPTLPFALLCRAGLAFRFDH